MNFIHFIKLLETPTNQSILEAVKRGYLVCFEGTVLESEPSVKEELLIDSNEADQLSTALKNIELHTKLDKESLSQIYLTFIKMDKDKFNQPLSDIFQKLKVMLIDLLHGKTTIEEILKFLNQYV
jgi:uncharacterized protein YicC (UPF0701 family)